MLLHLVLTALAFAPTGSTAAPPNVLFIYVDDWARDLNVDLGAYLRTPVRTPHTDGLRDLGMEFTHAWTPVSLCHPSRVSTLLSLRPAVTGVWDNTDSFTGTDFNGIPTLPYRFQQGGYTTGGTGKIFHDGPGDPSQWDEYQEFGDDPGVWQPSNPVPQDSWKVVYYGPYMNGVDGSLGKHQETKRTDYALDMMGRLSEPWFIAVGYRAPHLPWIYPQEFESLYSPDIDVPALPPVEFTDEWTLGLDSSIITSQWFHPEYLTDFIDPRDSWRRRATAAYWRSITYVDDELGRLLAGLNALGKDQDTIIVVVSDHGWSNLHHRRYGKARLWDWDLRSPLTIRAPGLPAAAPTCATPVELMDVYPTLMDLCGLTTPHGVQGKSLVPLMKNPNAAFKPAIAEYGSNMAIRSGSYKLHFRDTGRHQLYDMDRDPGEYRNLYGDPAYDHVLLELVGQLQGRGILTGRAFVFPYGTGLAGTQNTPVLTGTKPVLGSNLTLSLGNSLGQRTAAILYVGTAVAQTPFLGGTLWLTPTLSVPWTIPSQGSYRSFAIPNDPSLVDLDLYLQAMESDPGAVQGFSLSNGVRLTLGY